MPGIRRSSYLSISGPKDLEAEFWVSGRIFRTAAGEEAEGELSWLLDGRRIVERLRLMGIGFSRTGRIAKAGLQPFWNRQVSMGRAES